MVQRRDSERLSTFSESPDSKRWSWNQTLRLPTYCLLWSSYLLYCLSLLPQSGSPRAPAGHRGRPGMQPGSADNSACRRSNSSVSMCSRAAEPGQTAALSCPQIPDLPSISWVPLRLNIQDPEAEMTPLRAALVHRGPGSSKSVCGRVLN